MTLKDWSYAKQEADRRMKASNGHAYVTILKTRCQYCGRSPRDKRRCGQWFQTFIGELDSQIHRLLTVPAAAHGADTPGQKA